MADVGRLNQSIHTLLIPTRPRLSGDEGGDGLDPRSVTEDDFGEVALYWDGLTLREVSPKETRRCLWDLIDLVGVPRESAGEASCSAASRRPRT